MCALSELFFVNAQPERAHALEIELGGRSRALHAAFARSPWTVLSSSGGTTAAIGPT